jgi:hypothetical protein
MKLEPHSIFFASSRVALHLFGRPAGLLLEAATSLTICVSVIAIKLRRPG